MDASGEGEFWDYVVGKLIDELLAGDDTGAPEILYHYTGGAALLGMLRNDRVWLTSLHSLNDPTEGHYGYSCFVNQWNSSGGEQVVVVDDTRFKSLFGDFVFCMSSVGDSLDQWRAYGVNGEGYCIGLKIKSGGKWVHRKMLYGPPLATRAVEVVKEHLPHFRAKWDASGLPKGKWRDASVASAAAALVSCEVKHSCYSSENEWRVSVYSNDPDEWMYRDGGVGISPYIECCFSDMFELHSICIGPKSRTSHLDIERLVRRPGRDQSIPVTRSNIPYR